MSDAEKREREKGLVGERERDFLRKILEFACDWDLIRRGLVGR